MNSLKQRILVDGTALNETVLKVDSFLNHGVDPQLMYEIGTIKRYFDNKGVTKIFTIESYDSTNCYESSDANESTYGDIKKATIKNFKR